MNHHNYYYSILFNYNLVLTEKGTFLLRNPIVYLKPLNLLEVIHLDLNVQIKIYLFILFDKLISNKNL